ncbi:hypothetical protein [Raineyella sp.]|uniref:hypothetical protein n=1 Tax=Raineyella sp. TaxID=1911550 RepID=UPI002B1EC834|nr:hypothetical protein [Raineyella sp.]MEA5055305.1 hypothetical protein [Propionicimonas sp.]MEA5155650.1 hypothetical protein [Raineyella sp.]
MTEQNDAVEGTVLPPKVAGVVKNTAGALTAADALSALTTIVNAVQDSIEIHQTESTKREKLKTYRETEVRRIKAAEATLRDYFDRTFEERRETNKRLFDSLDLALKSGDVAAMQTVVGGIVDVARTSPLANIGDLGELRRAMDDPDTVFEF